MYKLLVLHRSLVFTIGMTALGCNALAPSTTLANSPFPGDKPSTSPTLIHAPYAWVHTERDGGEKITERRQKLGQGSICVIKSRFSKSYSDISSTPEATNWNATAVEAQSDLRVRKTTAQGWWYTGTTSVLGKTQGLVGILESSSPRDPSAHFQAIAALFKSTATKSTNFSR